MQASGQQISMLNFCMLVMECYVGPSVTCCHQKLTRTCTCCIFVIFILFGCMLFQQCPICLGWRSESRASKKMHLRKHVCSYLIYLTVNIPPWPSMTVITSCCLFVVHVCVCLCVCVPLYAVLSHLLNIMVAPSGRGNKGVCLILYSNLLFLRWTQNQLKNKHEQRQINLRCHDACFIFDNSCYSSWFLMGLVLQVPDYLFGFPSSSQLYTVFWTLFGWLSLKLVNIIFDWFKIGAGLQYPDVAVLWIVAPAISRCSLVNCRI